MVYHLLFLDLQIKRYDFLNIGFKSDLNLLFGSGLIREPARGVS
jgi:hypothetical protein